MHKHTLFPSITNDLDNLEQQDFASVIRTLTRSVESTKNAISAFHLAPAEVVIHYHHTLYSVLCSMEQLLHAIELLLSNDLEYQVRPLIRLAYDLFLNFYIDWLYPEKMGPLFQALAVLSRIDKSHPEYASLNDAIRKTFGGLVRHLDEPIREGKDFSPRKQGSSGYILRTITLCSSRFRGYSGIRRFSRIWRGGAIAAERASENASIFECRGERDNHQDCG